MARFYVTDNQSYGAQAFNLASGDSLFVTSTGNMNGQSSSALIVATSAAIENDGTITNNFDCINLTNSTFVNNGKIVSNGSNGAYTVWEASGTNSVYNTGSILNYDSSGFATAVSSNGSAGKIVNSGVIASYVNGYAIRGVGSLTIENHGTISGPTAGVAMYTANTSSIQNIYNDGIISGRLSLGAGADVITNSGTIHGNIDLGSGANVLVNHGLIDGAVNGLSGGNTYTNDGRITGDLGMGSSNDSLTNTYGVITGNITGGLGDDTINGGAQRDVIYGDDLSGTDTGGGADSLFGFYGDDVIHGGFGNDTIQGNQGNDVLYGDAGNDFLHGGQDSDQLYGGDGNDILNGGLGADVLTGGAGDDRFVYALNFGRDTIADFSAVSGNNDTIQFQAGTFANYADVQSHMVQQGANVVIELNVNDSVVLLNTTTAALTSDHFIFG